MQIDKVYAKHRAPFSRATYEFLTAEQLKRKFDGALRKTRYLLLMPPIMPIREDRIETLSKDPEIQGCLKGKMVFIDASYGLKDEDRSVWVRHVNGVLETTDERTKRRLIETYFPFNGRKVEVPAMFFGDYLDDTLDSGKYTYVLDRCLLQFEPYEKDFHRVTSRTYDHINQRSEFEALRSTRHFGPMAFYLAWHRLIDNLVIDCIRRDQMRNAVEAVCLMYNLHQIAYDLFVLEQLAKFPRQDDEYRYQQIIDRATADTKSQFEVEKTVGKSHDEIKVDDICLSFLDEYVKSAHCQQPFDVKKVLHTYREHLDQHRSLLESVEKAHGM